MPLKAMCLGFLVVMAVQSSAVSSNAQELVMFEERGCYWCARWTDEIGGVYPRTAEGKAAPLRRVDMHRKRPDDLLNVKPVTYSPTFVLVHEETEIGRIEGYPGEDFFWGLLGKMIEKLPGRETP